METSQERPVRQEEKQQLVVFLNLMTIVGQGGGSNQLCQILLSDQGR